MILFSPVFIFNIITIFFYYSIGKFFLSVMSKNYKKDLIKFKVLMFLTIFIVVSTNIRENLISYLLMMEGVFGLVYYDRPEWIIVAYKTMDYFKTIHPFVIATFILIIIRYLANDD